MSFHFIMMTILNFAFFAAVSFFIDEWYCIPVASTIVFLFIFELIFFVDGFLTLIKDKKGKKQ